jgi:hypothetical protein
MDGWTCPEGHVIDNDGSCPCTDRRSVSLSTWGSLAIAAAILISPLTAQAATFSPPPGQGAPQQASGAASR